MIQGAIRVQFNSMVPYTTSSILFTNLTQNLLNNKKRPIYHLSSYLYNTKREKNNLQKNETSLRTLVTIQIISWNC